jgi:hypothetical protein
LPPQSAVIPGLYAELLATARRRYAEGDDDPRYPGSPHDRRNPNVQTMKATLAALERGDTVKASRWQVISTPDRRTLPMFSTDVMTYWVTPDDVVTPADRLTPTELAERRDKQQRARTRTHRVMPARSADY